MSYVYDSTEFLIPLSWSMYEDEFSPGVQERYDFYEAQIYPTTVFGGTQFLDGWDCNYVTYQSAYDSLVTLESPFEIELQFEQLEEELFEVSAEVVLTENIVSNDNKILFAITNWIDYSEENPWFYLVIAKSTEEDVTLTNIGDTAVYSAVLEVEMQPDWNPGYFHAVAIIQNWENLEVLQAAQKKYAPTPAGDDIVPLNVSLHQNYPNPFNPSTTIKYDLQQEAEVIISVYNVKGQEVDQLVSSQKSAGQHSVIWNGNDSNGKAVPSGIYFYSLKAVSPDGSRYTSTKKMILLK